MYGLTDFHDVIELELSQNKYSDIILHKIIFPKSNAIMKLNVILNDITNSYNHK